MSPILPDWAFFLVFTTVHRDEIEENIEKMIQKPNVWQVHDGVEDDYQEDAEREESEDPNLELDEHEEDDDLGQEDNLHKDWPEPEDEEY